MWFGDEGIGGGRHGYLGSEKAVPAQEVPGPGRENGPTARPVIVMGPIISLGVLTGRRPGAAALTSSCVLPFLPFLFWQIRLEHLRRLFREEREKLADPDSRRAKAEVEALLKRDAP